MSENTSRREFLKLAGKGVHAGRGGVEHRSGDAAGAGRGRGSAGLAVGV